MRSLQSNPNRKWRQGSPVSQSDGAIPSIPRMLGRTEMVKQVSLRSLTPAGCFVFCLFFHLEETGGKQLQEQQQQRQSSSPGFWAPRWPWNGDQMFNHKLHNQPPTRKQAGQVVPGCWCVAAAFEVAATTTAPLRGGQMVPSGGDRSSRKPARAICRQQV